jgi:hypothetical protein
VNVADHTCSLNRLINEKPTLSLFSFTNFSRINDAKIKAIFNDTLVEFCNLQNMPKNHYLSIVSIFACVQRI